MMQIEVMSILLLLSIWDLWHQELPIVVLLLFSVVALWHLSSESGWTQIMQLVSAILIGLTCIAIGKNGQIGKGDIWVLINLALVWPLEVYWLNLIKSFLLLSVAAVLQWGCMKDRRARIPFVPFLMVGYWVPLW